LYKNFEELTIPRKYTGYRGFASFVASDTDFFVLRRFDKLNARVLLTLQDQLATLEERLEELDNKYSARNAPDIDNGTCRGDQPDRTELIDQISVKVREYSTDFPFETREKLINEKPGEVLQAHSDLRAYPRATQDSITSVKNWFLNNSGAIIDPEQRFISYSEDLISIVREEKAGMRRFFETNLLFRLRWFWKKGVSDVPGVDKATRYTSDDRVDVYTTVAVFVVGLFMLIAPLWILAVVNGQFQKLGTITAFVVSFLGILLYATVAKPFETLAATAA
jgi:hypothetical protein